MRLKKLNGFYEEIKFRLSQIESRKVNLKSEPNAEQKELDDLLPKLNEINLKNEALTAQVDAITIQIQQIQLEIDSIS